MQAARVADAAGMRAWWRDAGFAHRLVSDLVRAELAAQRPGVPLPRAGLLPLECSLPQDLDVDSLELLTLAGALSELTQMHESGIEDYLLVRPTIGDWVEILRHALESHSVQLTFRTSGSTGEPKRCSHALWTLCQEAQALSSLFAGRRRLLVAVPAHHIYGFLFTILLPQAGEGAALPVVDLRGAGPAALAREARDGDLVIGFPDWWRGMLRAGARTSADVVGVTSTAPCPADVARGIADAGVRRLVEIYGSSESAGIGWRDRHDAPYRLFSHWSRGADGSLTRLQQDGSLLTLTCRDRLDWGGERDFLPAGRIDDAVQIGGINVFPERVREILRRHPEVADAAVRLMRPEEGSRLKAFIVPRDPACDTAALAAALAAWTRTRLSTPALPKSYSFGAVLPVSETGKACDWPIAPLPPALPFE
jgi:4-coumarate--CoA ligase (photoactive yellow protein activation family)